MISTGGTEVSAITSQQEGCGLIHKMCQHFLFVLVMCARVSSNSPKKVILGSAVSICEWYVCPAEDWQSVLPAFALSEMYIRRYILGRQ